MYKNLELLFEKGTILTKEMLKELQEAAKDLPDIQYQCYPDGILAGTEILERDGSISILGGLLKYGGRIYRSPQEADLTGLISDWMDQGIIKRQGIYRLYFKPQDDRYLDGRKTQRLHALQLDVALKSAKIQGIPFADFKLAGENTVALFREGDFKDISRASFWNMTACPYACRDGVTYHPYIFEAVRRMLVGKQRKSALDYVILNQLSVTGVLGWGFIRLALQENGMEAPQYAIDEEVRAAVLRDFITAVQKEQVQLQPVPVREAPECAKLQENGRLLP